MEQTQQIFTKTEMLSNRYARLISFIQNLNMTQLLRVRSVFEMLSYIEIQWGAQKIFHDLI